MAECCDLCKRNILFGCRVVSFISHLESFGKVFKVVVAAIHFTLVSEINMPASHRVQGIHLMHLYSCIF